VFPPLSISSRILQKPPRHALHQAPQDLAVLHPQNLQPLDLLPQLVKLGGVRLLQLHLHPAPHILYRVEIRGVALADWLVCESDALNYNYAKEGFC
jgi:hypothetical protein